MLCNAALQLSNNGVDRLCNTTAAFRPNVPILMFDTSHRSWQKLRGVKFDSLLGKVRNFH